MVSETELTVAEGGSATYTVELSAKPEADVTVAISAYPSGALTVSHESLTFTVDNWDTPQTVTLTAAEDDDKLNYWTRLTHKGTGGGVNDRAVGIRVVIADDEEEE